MPQLGTWRESKDRLIVMAPGPPGAIPEFEELFLESLFLQPRPRK